MDNEKELSKSKEKQKCIHSIISSLKAKSGQYHQNIELLEEEYIIQQNMLINHTSKYETLNHLLNQIVIRDDGKNSINNPNNNKDPNDINNKINSENEIANNYVKSEDILADKFKEINNQIMNVNTGSINKNNNNDSIDSGNSSKKKKKFVYTKIFSFNNTNNQINNNNQNQDFTNHKNNLYLETHKETSENNQNEYNSNANHDTKENQNFVYEKIETSDKIEIEEIKSYEFILLDLIKFQHVLLEKLTNGKLDQYSKLTPDYLREKFSKIVELVKFTRNSCNNSQMTSSSKNNSCCNDSNNSILINNEGETSKRLNPALNHNFKKIKFSNKIINDFSRKNTNNENNYSYGMSLNNIGIDEKFLLDLIIKDLVLITNIKYEKIERVINLLIKINYVNKNIRLREEFILKEYPQNKKFLMDKILYIEKRIEAKYEKIKTMNFYIKKTEGKLNEINKNLNTKKNELEENRNYLRNFEAEINAMRENEESLRMKIDYLNKEEQNVENEFKEKLSEIEKQNKKLEEKFAKKNKKLKELNDMKKNNESNNNNNISNLHSNKNNSSNLNNTFKNSNFIRSQNNHENEVHNLNQYPEEEQDTNNDNNSSMRKNNRRDNNMNYLNDNSSNSSINKYKRNRANNLSNGINNPNSNSNRFYGSSNSSNFRNINPNNRENSNDLREENKNNFYHDDQYNHHNNECIQYDYTNLNYNDINRDQEINISENPNDNQNKNSSRRKSSGSRSKERESNNSNREKFIVKNNIYTKYKYPSENKFRTRRDVSIDSSSIGNKGYKNYYLFEEKNNDKRTIKTNSRNKNSSISSKKGSRENLANYSRSPNNYAPKTINSINKSTRIVEKNFDTNKENNNLYNNYPVKKDENKKKDNYNKNINYIDSYFPNRRINSTRILKDSEISSEYIDPELQKNLNDIRYEKKLDSKNKNNNFYSNNNSRSGSRRNSHRQSHYINNKERSLDRKFQTLTGMREYNKQKLNNDEDEQIHKKENIQNNYIDEQKNNYENECIKQLGLENTSNVPHTSFRRFRNPSYSKLLNPKDLPEQSEKDRNRYLITKTNHDENNLSFNENSDYHRDNICNNYNRIYKEYPNQYGDKIKNNEIFFDKNYNNYENEDHIYKQVNESNISNEFRRSKTSSGAAYLRKNSTNSRAKNTNYLYYEKIPVRENNREHDTKSINSNVSAKDFKLDKTAIKDEHHFSSDKKYKEKDNTNNLQNDIKSPRRIKNLVEETKTLIYGGSNKKSKVDSNNFNSHNNSILANRNFSNFSSNDFSNNSFRNNSRQKNINFSNFNTTANSNRNFDNFSGANNVHSNMMSLENSRRSIPINNNIEYEINKFKDLQNDDYNRILAENRSKIKEGSSKIPRHQIIHERKTLLPKTKEKFDSESREKINLLGLNYNYELTQKSSMNTNNSTQNSEKKSKINYTDNILRNYKNKLFTNKNNIINDNKEYTTSSRFNLQSISNAKIIAETDANEIKSIKSETIYNSNINKTIKLSNDFDNIYANDSLNDYKTYNKPENKILGVTNKSNGNFSSPRVERNFSNSNSKDFNSDLDYFSFNEKIFHLEQGCIIYKRNNFFGSKKSNKISSNIFYSSEFNPLDYGFKKYFCAFDAKRNKINFTKENNFSDKKCSDLYIASITSYKIPQYTKNLVFIKQVYKKYLKNFDSIDQMDDYINKNTHFLVNLYYNNCKDKEIKFDNRLYLKQFRRELLSNNNFIVYLNLLSENTRIEIMFVEYEDFKYWINGLQELVSLKNC